MGSHPRPSQTTIGKCSRVCLVLTWRKGKGNIKVTVNWQKATTTGVIWTSETLQLSSRTARQHQHRYIFRGLRPRPGVRGGLWRPCPYCRDAFHHIRSPRCSRGSRSPSTRLNIALLWKVTLKETDLILERPKNNRVNGIEDKCQRKTRETKKPLHFFLFLLDPALLYLKRNYPPASSNQHVHASFFFCLLHAGAAESLFFLGFLHSISPLHSNKRSIIAVSKEQRDFEVESLTDSSVREPVSTSTSGSTSHWCASLLLGNTTDTATFL